MTKRKTAHKTAEPGPAKQEVATVPNLPARVVPTFDPVKVMESIERMAGNKAVNVDKMRELLAFQKELMAMNAKVAFDEAMRMMQQHLPVFAKAGRIEIESKEKAGGRVTKAQATPYAKWEDVSPLLTPILADYGFTLRHRTETAPDGKVRVITMLDGYGHREETYLDLPYDTGGSKNNVQAVASSVAYGKRHNSFALLNLVAKFDDDDAKSSGRPTIIGDAMNDEEIDTLVQLCAAANLAEPRLLKYLNERRPDRHPEAQSLKEIPRARYQDVIDAVREWENAKAEYAKKAQQGGEGAQTGGN